MTEGEYIEKLRKIERRLRELEIYAEDAEEEVESALNNCSSLKEQAKDLRVQVRTIIETGDSLNL